MIPAPELRYYQARTLLTGAFYIQDLISYEVSGRDPICLDEAVEGRGRSGTCTGVCSLLSDIDPE